MAFDQGFYFTLGMISACLTVVALIVGPVVVTAVIWGVAAGIRDRLRARRQEANLKRAVLAGTITPNEARRQRHPAAVRDGDGQ